MSCHVTFCPSAHLARKVRRGKRGWVTEVPVTRRGGGAVGLPPLSCHKASVSSTPPQQEGLREGMGLGSSVYHLPVWMTSRLGWPHTQSPWRQQQAAGVPPGPGQRPGTRRMGQCRAEGDPLWGACPADYHPFPGKLFLTWVFWKSAVFAGLAPLLAEELPPPGDSD